MVELLVNIAWVLNFVLVIYLGARLDWYRRYTAELWERLAEASRENGRLRREVGEKGISRQTQARKCNKLLP